MTRFGLVFALVFVLALNAFFFWNTMNIWAGLLPLLAYIIYIGIYGGNSQ